MAITLNGGQSGANYSSDLLAILEKLNVSYQGSNAPTEAENGTIWYNSNADEISIQVNGSFIKLPFTPSTGNIAAGAGTGVTGLTTSNFASPDFDLAGGTAADNSTIASANAITTYVEAEVATLETADSNHASDTSTHGVGVIVGTTETQPLSNKTITASTISGTPITGSTGQFTSLNVTDGTTNDGGTITSSNKTITIDPHPSGTEGTLVIDGDLTVNGTTTTINSTTKSLADKDIVLASNATVASDLQGGGVILGSATSGTESMTFNSSDRWEASSPFQAEAFNVGMTNIIDTSGNWVDRANSIPVTSLSGTVGNTNLADATTTTKGIASFNTDDFSVTSGAVSIKTDGIAPATQIAGGTLASDVKVNNDNFDTTGSKQLAVNKGGTGKVTVTADTLLRGAGAGTLVETTIGDGLKLTSNSLDVDPTEVGVEEFNNIPGTFGSAGDALVVNSGGTALEYSSNVVDISAVESWARVTGGAGTTALTNRVLVHNGTDAATGYAWVDANDSDSLDVGLGATEAISVASVSMTGNNGVGGNLTVAGNTDLGDAATDTLTINANIDSDVNPSTNNARDLGSNSRRWAEVHTNNLALNGKTLSDVATTGTLTDSATTAASSKSVRDYISSLSLGGSIVIEGTSGTAKDIDADALAVVTISGITKIFTAKVARTGVVKGTDFDGTGSSGQDFTNTTNWTEFTAVGGTQVTINKFTGNGTLFSFTLTTTPESENDINVFIDGVYQLKDAYTLSGSTLSFGTGNPVPNGSKVEVLIGTSVNFASGSIGNVTASGTITAPTIGTDLTTTLRGDGSQISGLPAGYTGWTVSDGTNTSLTSSSETLTVTDGGGTTAVVSDNTLTISSPSLGTGSTQAARGNHDHESVYTEIKSGATGTDEGFFIDTNGAGISKTVRFRYRNGTGTITTLDSISVSDILSGVTIDDLG